MVKVEFLGPINCASLEVDVATLSELAQELQKREELDWWLEKSAVAVNDEITNDLNLVLKSGDRVSILPPVCGG